ncbi:MAG: hypothetical protein LKM41_01440 [Lachnospiraceae bacterium]|jgi:hypothetical protein|nr:hypothetical protein [Lachnospiraceae bacterium]
MSTKTGPRTHEPLIRISKRTGISRMKALGHYDALALPLLLALVVSGLSFSPLCKAEPHEGLYRPCSKGAFGTAKRCLGHHPRLP